MYAAAASWGLTTVQFVLGYAALAAVATGYAVVTARRHVRPAEVTETYDRLDAEQVGYLRAGDVTAVIAAVTTLRVRRQVAVLRHGRLIATGSGTPGPTTALQALLLRVLSYPMSLRDLWSHREVPARLRAIDAQLCRYGLLSPERTFPRGFVPATAVLGVLALVGLLRLVTGDDGRNAGYVVLVMMLLGAGFAVLLVRAYRPPHRTRAGDAQLAALWERHADLHPRGDHDWRARPAADVAMSVALYGEAAFYALDAELRRPLTPYQLRRERQSGSTT